MGTNYYFNEKPPCDCCGREHPKMHIGKSSAGWCFALHVIPDAGIVDLCDWETKWVDGHKIEDEYGLELSSAEMISIITERNWTPRYRGAHWYAENYAQPGPNGLIRSRVDGTHCIGHGSGTWDLIAGEFS